MMKFYTIDRTGLFNSKENTSNQCKDVGHKNYEYSCRIFFDPKTRLNEFDFLIDHNEVNAIIMNCLLSGSCERMHIIIMDALLKRFEMEKIEVMAIRVTINPVYPTGLARLTHSYVRLLKYLPLIN